MISRQLLHTAPRPTPSLLNQAAASSRPSTLCHSPVSWRSQSYRTSASLRRPLAHSTWGRGAPREHHAAAKNIKWAGAGSPAVIASRLRAVRVLDLPQRHPHRISTATLQTCAVQIRSFSDRKDSLDSWQATQHAQKTAKSNVEPPLQDHQDNKTILDRLPHLHRPTKEELLAAANGFWHRLSIRFKWGTIRSVRPYTLDEIGAFVSWIFLGHVIWIVIGTTTFVSLAIWAVNTVFAQETVAGWVGNYLTKSSGVKIVFESAIVPKWRNGVITFNNVFVSRRPRPKAKRERSVSKGSSTTAAAAAEAAAMAGRSGSGSAAADVVDEGNYSQFDVTIRTVNVTLSFSKWFNGKGLLRDVEIIGVRGVIDRTHVQPVQGYVDPKSYRHEHDTGDFEIDDFKMSDVLLTIHQPNNFRPFSVSVFNCELPRLRKQWLFYDFMSANNMSGSFDESLFTVHPRQVHGHTGVTLTPDGHEEGDAGQWKKHSRLRIDGLKIDHLNRGVEGPFSWITEGSVDIVADVMIPSDEDGIWRQSWRKSAEAVTEFYERVEASVVASAGHPHQHHHLSPPEDLEPTHYLHDGREGRIATPPRPLPTTSIPTLAEGDKPLILSINCNLHDIRANVPLFTRDLSYVNNALVRPIVAYINSRHGTFIPIHCQIVKTQSEFDGSWTIFDSGLLEDLSREVYAAVARDVEDAGKRKGRMRKVGWWGVQVVAQALFIGLAGQLA